MIIVAQIAVDPCLLAILLKWHFQLLDCLVFLHFSLPECTRCCDRSLGGSYWNLSVMRKLSTYGVVKFVLIGRYLVVIEAPDV